MLHLSPTDETRTLDPDGHLRFAPWLPQESGAAVRSRAALESYYARCIDSCKQPKPRLERAERRLRLMSV